MGQTLPPSLVVGNNQNERPELRLPQEVRLQIYEGRQGLLWRASEHPDDEEPTWRRSRVSGSDYLMNFVKLADAPDKELLAYAQTYGVLCLCQHGAPLAYVHCKTDQRAPWASPFIWNWEPLGYWRQYARYFAALLDLGKWLRIGAAPVEQWRPILDNDILWSHSKQLRKMWSEIIQNVIRSPQYTEHYDGNLITSALLEHTDQRQLFAEHLSHLLRVGAVMPAVEWDDVVGELQITLSHGGGLAGTSLAGLPGRAEAHGRRGGHQLPRDLLFSVLVAKAVSLITSGTVDYCSHCGNRFAPKRVQAPGEHRYCGSACRKLAYYHRNKHKKKASPGSGDAFLT